MRLNKSLRLFALVVFCGLLLSGCATQASQAVSNQGSQSAKPAKHYLFLVSADYAHIHKTKTSYYALTMHLPAIHQVVAFTDRPNRNAGFISAQKLQDLWSLGANDFSVDHPNAVLSAKKMQPMIVEISKVQTHANDIVLTIRPLSQRIMPKALLQKVTLTIAGTERINHHINSQSLTAMAMK